MRSKTGIKGLDELMMGGFPKGSVILLSGTPGTGKTILALQYVYNGAQLYDEKSLYITFEEKKDNVISQARQFGWDFETQKNVLVWSIPSSTITKDTVDEIISFVKEKKIKRIVIDSLSTLCINVPTEHMKLNEVNDYSVKQFVYSFLSRFSYLDDTTTLVISQVSDSKTLSRDTVSEFICDGVINVMFESMGGEFSRTLLVRKMRRTKNDEDLHPMEIGKEGIVVHNLD